MNAKDILTGIIFGDDSGGGGGVTVSPLSVTENGTYTAPEGQAYSPVMVNVQSGGGAFTTGVIFIDYDGTEVEKWDKAEVAGKTALPDNPSHTGLIAQGWNWTLQSIKDYIADYPTANVLVGQMYKTSSGLTEIDITVTKVTDKTVTCNMVGNKNWGDGTEDNLTEHTYADYGDYTITCDGTSIPAGEEYTSGGLFDSTAENMNRFWCTAIRIGENVTGIAEWAFVDCSSLISITIPDSVTSIGEYAFSECGSLTSITLSHGITNIGENAFSYCTSLTSIIIPDSVTSIGLEAFAGCGSLISITIQQGVTSIEERTFAGCGSLTSIIIPDSVTSIGLEAFVDCSSLISITIPDSVASIGEGAFAGCVSLTRYDFTSATSVPTLYDEEGYAFDLISGLCKIIVPDALYDDWIVAENWANYADYIYKASEVGA